MHESRKKWHRACIPLVLVLFTAALTACENTKMPSETNKKLPSSFEKGEKTIPQPEVTAILHNSQLLIKFSKHLSTLDISKKLDEITRNTGIKLVYLRAMSAGAHVISAENISNDTPLSEIIEKINNQPDVEYVEADGMMQHQNTMQQGGMQKQLKPQKESAAQKGASMQNPQRTQQGNMQITIQPQGTK